MSYEMSYEMSMRVASKHLEKMASFDKEANLSHIIKSTIYSVPADMVKSISTEISFLTARLFRLHKKAIINGCRRTFEAHVLSMLALKPYLKGYALKKYEGVTYPTLVKFDKLDPLKSEVRYGDLITTTLYEMMDVNSDFMLFFWEDDIDQRYLWAYMVENMYRAWANNYYGVLLRAQGKRATVKVSEAEFSLEMSQQGLVGHLAKFPLYIVAHIYRFFSYTLDNVKELVKECLYLLLRAFVGLLEAPFILGKALIDFYKESLVPASQGK